MASFNHIGGAEPSTVTFKIATITQTRNSSAMHQEILSIGDPDTSNAIAAVLAAAPASTAWGMVTRQAGNVGVTQATNPWIVAQSSAADLNVTVANFSTTHNVSSLAGAVNMRSSAANALVTVYQSTAADLNVTVANFSTTVTVANFSTAVRVGQSTYTDLNGLMRLADRDQSTQVAAVLNATPASTVWALAVRDVVPNSTTIAVSSLAGKVTIDAFSTSVAGNLGFHFDTSGSLLTAGGAGGSSQVTISQVLDSSGGGVVFGDSANSALRVNVVAGAAGGSTLITIRQSTYTDLNGLMRLADRDQSTQVAAVLNATPASTVWALAVRDVVPNSTTIQVSSLAGAVIVRSSAADALVTVYQSTASNLQATVTQVSTTWAVQLSNYSTTMNVSSLAGAVIVRSSAADALVTVYQSTASALLATVTIGTNLQSTAAPSSNSSGLVVRQVVDGLTTFASTSALASTVLSVASSVANMRFYVTAYTITSTNQTPAQWGFFSSNATLLWPITLASLSSATCGANLAVGPPGYLFRTTVNEALNFKTNGSTVISVQLGVSYFTAP